MKIAALLDNIDAGVIALPEFQRGYVWNREQVRGLMESLYRRHPVGSLLIWATQAEKARSRGDEVTTSGNVKLLLDGQQRLTSLYGIARGKPPRFFDGNLQAFTGLRFNLDTEEFAFYSPVRMGDDPMWIDVSEILAQGSDGTSLVFNRLSAAGVDMSRMGEYIARLSRLQGILDIELHVEELTGQDKTIDTVVEIFNKVNSGGTKLSKGDLALAKICADWPEARDEMKAKLSEWANHGYDFDLDWLLRNVNTVLTGEAKFQFLHEKTAADISDGLMRSTKRIDEALNMIADRLGLDHSRVLFGRYAIPVMSRLLDRLEAPLDQRDADRLLFWFVQAGMWGRFSGSTESFIDQDLAAIESGAEPIGSLIEQLRLWHGQLKIEPGHFAGWSLGARFYPVLYMLTRVTGGRDLMSGLPLKANLLGKLSSLEVHHIFPKSLLYREEYARPEVNAIANFCFLTKESNLKISNGKPEEYLPELEAAHPGVLASQWIPEDPALWNLACYPDFLEARKTLLSDAANTLMRELLHGDVSIMGGPDPSFSVGKHRSRRP